MILFIYSCTKTKEKDAIEIKTEQKDLSDKIKRQITEDYGIKYKWDTLEYFYSIAYKPVIETKQQMIDEFMLNDIYWEAADSSYHISLEIFSFPSFYFDLKIDLDNLNKLDADFSHATGAEKFYFNELGDIPDKILVVRISDFQKLRFEIASEIESDENSVSSHILVDKSNHFYGKGHIIDVISIKN